MEVSCPFCNLDAARIWLENAVGIALHDALRVARGLPAGATVVTLLCDRAECYFSTPLFVEGDADGVR
jgi:hypothetical protein